MGGSIDRDAKADYTATKAYSVTPRDAGVLEMAEPGMVQAQCSGTLPGRDLSGADDIYGFGGRRSQPVSFAELL
jgi:hypothetical protein